MVPVVLITGFLGSGKTTLLNRLMARRAVRGERSRIALIVNELGEVGIDGSLLPPDMTRQVELPGGCICCVLNDDLDRTLLEVIARNPGLEAIVIETTGVAEPLPIAWSLEREPLANEVRLAAVITLVDASNFLASQPLSPAVNGQVEYADVVVLTKRELVPPEQADAVRAAVAALAPRAPRVEGTSDEVAEWLEGVVRDPPVDRIRGAAGDWHDHADPHHDHHHADVDVHTERTRAHGIDSVWVPIEGLLDLEELVDALEALPPAFVRVKGIARVIDPRTGSDEPHYAAFHRVGLRVSTEPLPAWAHEAPTRAVALGPGISAGPLAACVARAVLSSKSEGRGAERWP